VLTLTAIVLIAVIWQAVNYRVYRDVLSPLSLLLFSWMIPLALGWLDLSLYEQPWGATTAFTICWVTGVLIAASLVPALALRRPASFAEGAPGLAASLSQLSNPRVLRMLLAIFAVTFGIYFVVEFATNPAGIPALQILARRQLYGEFHRWGKETRWAIITPLLFVLCPMLYLASRQATTRAWRWGLLGLALLYPLFGLLKLSRSDVFVSALNLGLAEYYWRRHFHRRVWTAARLARTATLVAVGAGAVAALLIGTLSARLGSRAGEQTYARAIGFTLEGTGPAYELAAQVYGYLALPYENFRRTFELSEGGFRPGISALRPVLSASGQGRLADELLSETMFIDPVSSAAGSSTFLTPLYMELGIAGVLLVPLGYGLLVNALYTRFRASPSLLSFLLYLNFVYPWAWLYFNNAFSVLTFYLNAAFILAFAWSARALLPRLRW
jgi:oligosaccharide repeat unit polymerase